MNVQMTAVLSETEPNCLIKPFYRLYLFISGRCYRGEKMEPYLCKGYGMCSLTAIIKNSMCGRQV